jgi:7-keto-8-aminopelargonate synthetase-like enzyme
MGLVQLHNVLSVLLDDCLYFEACSKRFPISFRINRIVSAGRKLWFMLIAESNPVPVSSCDVVSFFLKIANMPKPNSLWMQLNDALRERAAAGLLRSRQVWNPLSPRMVQSSDGCRLIHFGSNDYLCLSWHPGVRSARSPSGREDCGFQGGFNTDVAGPGWDEFQRYITSSEVDSSAEMLRHGSGASPSITGNTPKHADLIDAIVNLERSESAILFSSGYAANAGTVSALATSEDVVFSDRLNHASLIDGCRLSRAKVIVFGHSDMRDLAEKMHLHRHVGKKAFVLSDSVFSMDGDVADLASILELCEKFDATSILDEAHATGVYGVRGAGLQEHLGVESDRLVRIGTLSKAVGCSGAFVAGPDVLIQWLVNHARPYIYSTSMPLPNALSACLALELMQGMNCEPKACGYVKVSRKSGIASAKGIVRSSRYTPTLFGRSKHGIRGFGSGAFLCLEFVLQPSRPTVACSELVCTLDTPKRTWNLWSMRAVFDRLRFF